MFSDTDRQRDTPSDSFASALSRLKRQGSSVLVVGSTCPAHQRGVSHRLLGNDSGRVRRRILVSTTGDWDRSLVNTTVPSDTRQVIRYDSQTRHTLTQQSTDDTHAPATDDTTAPAETLGELGIEISNAIETLKTDAGVEAFEPSELRIGIESLLPLLEDYSTEQVFKFIHLTNSRITAADGMVHYQLPVETDANVVSLLHPLFDICIELEEQAGRCQERWSLSDGNHCSGWLQSPKR